MDDKRSNYRLYFGAEMARAGFTNEEIALAYEAGVAARTQAMLDLSSELVTEGEAPGSKE